MSPVAGTISDTLIIDKEFIYTAFRAMRRYDCHQKHTQRATTLTVPFRHRIVTGLLVSPVSMYLIDPIIWMAAI